MARALTTNGNKIRYNQEQCHQNMYRINDSKQIRNRANLLQPRKVWVKGERVYRSFKMKDNLVSVRNTKVEDSRSEIEESAVDQEIDVGKHLLFKDGSDGQSISINMASNKEEDVPYQQVVGCLLNLVSKLTNGAIEWTFKHQPTDASSSIGNANVTQCSSTEQVKCHRHNVDKFWPVL